MTKDEARSEIVRRVGEAATDRIGAFLAMVVAEKGVQNLVAPSTIESIWSRHALDSVQLLALAEGRPGPWVDIGTGGGFPGMVIAFLRSDPVILVEPRRRRAEFLQSCASALELGHVGVRQARIEAIDHISASVISARAVASIENLLHAARRCGTPGTRWLLPRGHIDPAELTALQNRRTMFHVEHSITDPRSAILVIDGAGA